MAAAAFLLASAPQTAQASTPVAGQAFQASAESPTGGVVFSGARTTSLDEVQISLSEAVINWTPLDTDAPTFDQLTGLVDNPINILPSTRTLRFVSAGLDYTVLNRILPDPAAVGRPVQFNGNVESFTDISGTTPGGNIWFYSPGGIIAGATSSFDVGSLVLTTNDIDTTGGLFGSGGEIRFSGVADSTARVEIISGAEINALNDRSSYVAIVAPRIVQGGTVTVDGSVAYVAAEQADLTINNGLFDIAIGVGTSDTNGVVHTGTTTGPALTPTVNGMGQVTDADAQTIYMVAVPKNDAVTMLVGGSVGYLVASSATIDDGKIILSAGGDVTASGTLAAPVNSIEENTTSTAATNVQIGGTSPTAFGSTIEMFASNDITMSSQSATSRILISNSDGVQDLNLTAGNQINLNTSGGGQILVNGDVNLTAGTGATGGDINLNIDRTGFATAVDTGLRVSGNLTADSSASGADDFATVRDNGNTGIGQDAIGGDITINITEGGVLDVGGNGIFSTSAQGGKGENQNGSAQAGNIAFNMDSGPADFGGNANFNTAALNAGEGKAGGNGPGLVGSDSTAGDISLSLSGGEMTVTGNLGLTGDADGTSGSDSATAQNNAAVAGTIDLTISGGTHSFGSVGISSKGNGAFSFDAGGNEIFGDVSRGTVNLAISSDGTNLSITDNMVISTETTGNIISDPTVDAVTVSITDTGEGSGLSVTNALSIQTEAADGLAGTGLTSGSVSITADNGDFTFGSLNVDTSATVEFSATELSSLLTAGDVDIVAQNGGTISGGSVNIYANAATQATAGVDANGGKLLIHANDGFIGFTGLLNADVSAQAGATDATAVTNAQGGTVRILLEGTSPTNSSINFANIDFDSDGSIDTNLETTSPFEGDGGTGNGGSIIFDLFGGTFVAADIETSASGAGGRGGDVVTLSSPTATAPFASAFAAPLDLTVVSTALAASVSAGDGGNGQGGNVTFNLNGGNATVTNLTIAANGFGGDGADGDIDDSTLGGSGGRGTGGSAVFNAQAGSLTVTNTLTVSADGNNQSIAPYGSYGRGGFGDGTDAGAGGEGIGGTATFNLDGTATIAAGTVVISARADGGYGGSSTSTTDGAGTTLLAGVGGAGGNATGGNATFNNTTGTINFAQLSVTSVGTGGLGGNVSGLSSSDGDNSGGAGGSGTGGNATININQDDLNNAVYVINASGIGGDGGDGLDGGNGGAAAGGVAAININNVTAQLDDPTIIANATGGDGGEGLRNSANSATGNAGDGGNATAGTARLQVTGASGNIDIAALTLQANASGGNGAEGFYQFGGGIEAGDGGSGGDATGGTIELIARTGGTLSITSDDFTMTSTGTGGTGGDGGNSYDSAAGDAGDGGDATGGTSRILAQGGTITGNNLTITTTGLGGNGGARGQYSVFGTDGADGTGGNGSGGTGIIEIQEGSPGIVTFTDVAMNASGTGGGGPTAGTGAGGRIEISDSSTDPAGLISFDSLTANAFDTAIGTGTGSSSATLGGFFTTADSGAISILGNLTVNMAGNILYDLDGTAQMTVGGNASLISGQNIQIDHINNATAVNSLDIAGTFSATAQGNFVSTDGSVIDAAGTASVRAEQNATVADLSGVDSVNITALQNVTVDNAAVTGTPDIFLSGSPPFVFTPSLTINAGYNPNSSPSPTFDPVYNATITGDLTSTGIITVGAGGSAFFRTGAAVVSDNSLAVRTGDDIVIESGASLTAANNPGLAADPTFTFTNPGNLILQAGDFTGLFGSPIGTLSTTILTPISSITAAGNLDANSYAVVMTANAIDGLGGTITASSISVDINDAPANGVIQSNDDGLLSAQCVEGNVCLGALNADNLVHIGQASNNDVIQGIVESGTVSANDILVTIRNDIIMGSDGIATVLDASNQFLVESTEGDVDLRDASITSASVQVSAVNGSLLGSASLTSGNDIGITVGSDIGAASITTGGQLTTIALVGGASESLYTVSGSINVDAYTQGTAQRFRVEAGNDISFGQVTVPDSAIELIAAQAGSGDVFLGTTSGASSIVLEGDNAGYTDLDATVSAASSISIAATNGDISGGDSVSSSTTNLDATGGISFGSLTATGAVTTDAGGDIDFTAVDGDDTITMTAGGGINGGDLTAADTLSLNGGNITIGDASGGNVGMTSDLDILFDTISSAGSTTMTATSGTIGVNTAAGDITGTGLGSGINLFANDVTIGAITTNGGDILISAAQDITLGSAATGAGTPTAATIGLLAGNDISATGSLSAGEDVSIRALGDLALGTISAGDDFTVQADGAITLDSATTSGTGVDLFALSFNSASAGQAGSIAFASETSTGSNIRLTGSSDVTATGTLNANEAIIIVATGTPTLANAVSGGDTSITGAAVTLNSGTISGDLILNATAGSLDGNGTVTAGGSIDLDATSDIGFGDLDAQGGTFTIDAGGNINFSRAAASDDITLNAFGSIDGGDIDGAAAVMIDSGSDIILDDITGSGDIGIVANNVSDVTVGSVDSAANISVQMQGMFVADEVTAAQAGGGQVAILADNGIVMRNVTGNDIDLQAINGLINVTNDVDATNVLTVSGAAISVVTQHDMRVSAEATGGNMILSSTANLDIQGAEASGDIVLSAGGSVTINDTLSLTTSEPIIFTAPLNVASTGGDISVSAANDVAINNLVNAANNLQITAGSLINIDASTVASDIRTVSADMNIGSSGSLGQSAVTSDIRISSNGTTQMMLGDGTDLSGTFSLSNDEFSRIQSGGDLTIYAAETGVVGFDLTVQDLSASAFSDGNFGTDGNFNLSADQSIRVSGNLSVQGGLDTNLNLAAGDDLFVNATTGSIGMGNDSSLSGNLSLTARNIYAMTDQAFDDIQGLSTADIDARLSENDGNVRDSGFIMADAISVTLLASQIYVQNTGSGTDFDARRGFVAGAGGLAINAGPSGITPIVINGTVNGATGISAIPATTITGSGFDQQSTINGCVIANPASCAPTPTPTPTPSPPTPKIDDPVQDVIEEEVTPEEYAADPFASNPIEIKENEDLAEEPIIDEPVTGAGNDDLWAGGSECELDDSGKCLSDKDEEVLEPAE
ncbi:hypothetical protein [Sphingorhabdus sp. M41]|uniref:hypothetical protein n=1 Tax=Sphingorhabdus sp. M41 TaxID=1806885 RepID=UPI0012E95593|nr:hypothetical protein [Sphingorhabdus sp. M41]